MARPAHVERVAVAMIGVDQQCQVAGAADPVEVRFALNSPMEERGFEPSVLWLARSSTNDRSSFSEMHRGEFGGGLFAPDLPESTAQQGDDFLLNLRIVQQTQERPFESLVLLRLLDLVFSFGSVLHRSIMPQGSSAERPSVDVKNPSEWQFSATLVFFGWLIFRSSQNTAAVRMAVGLGTQENSIDDDVDGTGEAADFRAA